MIPWPLSPSCSSFFSLFTPMPTSLRLHWTILQALFWFARPTLPPPAPASPFTTPVSAELLSRHLLLHWSSSVIQTRITLVTCERKCSGSWLDCSEGGQARDRDRHWGNCVWGAKRKREVERKEESSLFWAGCYPVVCVWIVKEQRAACRGFSPFSFSLLTVTPGESHSLAITL